MYAQSSSLQYRIISYFYLLRIPLRRIPRRVSLILHKPLFRPALVVRSPELGVHFEILELPLTVDLDVLFRVFGCAPHGLVVLSEGAGLEQVPRSFAGIAV